MPRFTRGARRGVAAGVTLSRILPVAQGIGVTRLADVTGLDRIGVPVFQAIRPLARSLSVSQGKGLTPDAARVSALMEAIELHSVETLVAGSHGPAAPGEAALWARMPAAFHQRKPFDPAMTRPWLAATDLVGGGGMRVPLELVSMDCTTDRAADLWPNTNGLAAGNDALEAQAGALCEAIERDAQACWMAATPAARRATAIDPATIRTRAGRWLIGRISRAGLRLALWDMSGTHGLAAIGCAIVDTGAGAGLALPPAFGAGCHLQASVALVRAITEAAQTRVALIAGSRDDLLPEDYADPAGQRAALIYAMRDFGGGTLRDWTTVPDHASSSSEAERDHLLRVCAKSDCGTVPCIDLTPPDAPFAIVKIVVPGFGDHDRPSALPPLRRA